MVQPQRLTPGEQGRRQQSAEERDNELRGDPHYSARCSYWESLTAEDIWGGPRPSLPPIRELETS